MGPTASALSMGDKLRVPINEKLGNPPRVRKKQDGRHARKKPKSTLFIYSYDVAFKKKNRV